MKEKIIKYFKSDTFIKEILLPYLLTFSLSSAIFYAYGERFFSVWTLGQFLIITFAFVLFGFMRKHTFIGSIIYVMIGFFCLSLMFRFIFADDWGSGFQAWFLSGGTETESLDRYYGALLVSFPIFLASVVYYFSAVLYRTSFLMLASLIPCALYVKILSDMSNMYLVLIAGLNILIFAVNNRKMNLGKSERSRRTGIAAALSAVMLTLVIASLIPKQGDAKYYEEFERYFMNSGGNGRMSNFNSLSERSGNAQDFRNLQNTELYQVYSEDLVYFRRQCFDMYDPEQHNWYPLEKYSVPDPSYYEKLYGRQSLLNYDNILNAIKRGCELDPSLAEEFHLKSDLLGMDSSGETAGTAYLSSLSHPANYILSTVRSTSVSDYANNAIADSSADLHRCISTVQMHSPSYSYRVDYYREFTSRYKWFNSGGSDFTDEEYDEFLTRLYGILEDSGETGLCGYVEAFAEDHSDAMAYKQDYSENLSDIPSDLAELAHQLTDDLDYDWQKANTLQDFFTSGNFLYDIDYVSPAGSDSSYFVFTSKRGTCSDFATAFTLMARSVGLTVRYTEGFAPDYTLDQGIYVIRMSGSHAYPEVYIQNMGWIVFEPTVSGMYGAEMGAAPAQMQQDNNVNFSLDFELIRNVLLAVLFAALIVLFVIVIIPAGASLRDIAAISKGGSEAVTVMYRRIKKRLSRRSGKKVYAMTAEELSREAGRYGRDISGFIGIYSKVCFGGAEPDEREFSSAKEIYKAFFKGKL